MRTFLLIALTMTAFAANSLLNRLALAEAGMGAAAFAAIRLGAGAAVLLALAALRPGALAAAAARPAPGRALGVGALTLYMLGFSFAYRALPAGSGALILFGAVQVTMFAGALLLGERPPARRWAGAAVAFAGLVVLAAPGGSAAPPFAGSLAMAAAGIGWGLYSLAGRGEGDALGGTALNFALALLPALGALGLSAEPAGIGPAGLAAALASGAVTSGLGYALWYRLLPRIAPSVAAVAQLTVPLIAAAGGALLLAELPAPRFWAAAALVLGGVGLSLIRPRGR